MDWNARKQYLPDHNSLQISLLEHQRPISFDRLLSLLQSDQEFRSFYIDLLREVSYDAFFWEHPPLTLSSLHCTYEFVLVDARFLASAKPERPETNAFQHHFRNNKEVVSFDNLGKDARLVVPCPVSAPEAYPHLAAFVRKAGENQIHAFFQLLASTVRERLSKKPLWMSTAGMGVYWLHARLDSRPKYYRHHSYKTPDFFEPQ